MNEREPLISQKKKFLINIENQSITAKFLLRILLAISGKV